MSSLMTDVIERHEVSWRSSSLYEVGKFCGDFLGLLGISPTSILQLTSGALVPCDVWVPIKTAFYDGRWRLERTPFGTHTSHGTKAPLVSCRMLVGEIPNSPRKSPQNFPTS